MVLIRKKKSAFVLLLALGLQSCGLTLPADNSKSENSTTELGPKLIEGRFTKLEGEAIDLASDKSKIQVLMFVSETCSVCREETEALVQDRLTRGQATNAAFYSILVGSIPEDANDWRNDLGVNWIVGLDAGDALFKSYCPSLQTPCTILRNPSTGLVNSLVGKHSIADWENLTGPWSF